MRRIVWLCVCVCVCVRVSGMIQRWKEEEAFRYRFSFRSYLLLCRNFSLKVLPFFFFFFNQACLLTPHDPGNDLFFPPFYTFCLCCWVFYLAEGKWWSLKKNKIRWFICTPPFRMFICLIIFAMMCVLSNGCFYMISFVFESCRKMSKFMSV